MAVAFNSPTSAPIYVGAASSFSQAYTLTAGGSNLCAVARLEWASTTTATVTAISYNAVAMTSVHAAAINAPTVVQLFTLVAPATGSNTFAVTLSASESDLFADIGSFSGVDQSTPVRGSSYAEFTGVADGSGNASITITSNASDLTVSVFGTNNQVNTTTQTIESKNNSSGGACQIGTDHATTGAASVTHTWNTAASGNADIAGFSLQASGGAATAAPPRLMGLLGVGI